MISIVHSRTLLWWKYLFSWKLRNIYRYLRNSNLLHSLTHSLTLKTTRCWMWNAEKDKQFIFHFPPFHFSNHECQFFYFYLSHSNEKFDFIAFSGSCSLIWRVENIGFNIPLNASNLWLELFQHTIIDDYWEPIDVLSFYFNLFSKKIPMRYINYWGSNFQVLILHKIAQLFLIQFN